MRLLLWWARFFEFMRKERGRACHSHKHSVYHHTFFNTCLNCTRVYGSGKINSKLVTSSFNTMADVYQWRRRIQPGHSHPLMPVGEHSETEPDLATNGFGTSRKKVRPKISSYFHRTSSANHGRSAVWSEDQRISFKESISYPSQTWPEGCEPDPDQIMDSAMRTLMAEPYRPLDVKHNSPLLRIFESFRNLRDENAALLCKFNYELKTGYAAQHGIDLERQRWQHEREEYKAEVKRLELIICQQKEGVAGLMHARRGSILRKEHRRRTASGANTSRDDPRETVFEFLERTRLDDQAREEAARKAQRGMSKSSVQNNSSSQCFTVPLRNRPASPSQKMTALSHKLSTTSHYNDLPFDSPPSPQEFTSLSQVSMFEVLAGRLSLSDTDSSENDTTKLQHADRDTHDSSVVHPDIDGLLSRGTARFDTSDLPDPYPGLRASSFNSGSTEHVPSHTPKFRPNSLRLNHLKHARNFSFEYGDDDHPPRNKTQHGASSPLHHSIPADYSTMKLSTASPRNAPGMLVADAIVRSPLSTPMLESPGLSKIPSPVFDPSLARPRREDSSSSFLTVIRAEGDSSSTSNTLDSPHHSARNSVRGSSDSTHGHSGRLHDVNMAVAAARAAATCDSPKPSSELRGPPPYHTNA
jgi:hypothetical protein